MEVMDLSKLKKGMEFPTYRYTLRPDIIKTYLEAVEESDSLYTDEEQDTQSLFGHPVVPPTTIAIYVTPSRVLKTIKNKPPSGLIQTGQRFEFYHPIRIGETVTVKASIDDLYQKKGRNYVVLKGEGVNEQGQRAAVSYLTFIWPSQS
ncbi:MAG: hypothetical protein AMK69_00375 [Nitrospira bacterium SG8_3]|jgi:acyl dehydratase|nr:MAG: hypothetical protein AMK69_00375 [Nitrospira bacterium SG8_3]